jgi:hypothetical protein
MVSCRAVVERLTEQVAVAACAPAPGAVAPETRARLLDGFRAWHAALPRGGREG